MKAGTSRSSLPFREKTELFLLNGASTKVLAQDRGIRHRIQCMVGRAHIAH